MGKINVASVKFNDGDKQTYYYECTLDDVSVDDYVLVDAGGATKAVRVAKLEQMDASDLPFPVKDLKKILSRSDAPKKPKDKIKAEIAAYHEKWKKIWKLLKTEQLYYPFDATMEAVDEKQFMDLIAENGGDPQSIIGKTITTKANTHFKPQVFKDPQNDSAILLAFSSMDEIGQLEGKASFLPMTLDSMISFACDNEPYATKIIVNPWSDSWEIPTIVKIVISITVREKGDVTVAQGISIQRDGLHSSTTVHDDTDEREQNWDLGINSEATYLPWFFGAIDWACSVRRAKQTHKSEKSEIGIYYFYGNDNFDYVAFDADSLPEAVAAICRGICSAVPEDWYLALTKYKMVEERTGESDS